MATQSEHYRELMGKEPPLIPDGPLRHQWEYDGDPDELEALAREIYGSDEGEQESLF